MWWHWRCCWSRICHLFHHPRSLTRLLYPLHLITIIVLIVLVKIIMISWVVSSLVNSTRYHLKDHFAHIPHGLCPLLLRHWVLNLMKQRLHLILSHTVVLPPWLVLIIRVIKEMRLVLANCKSMMRRIGKKSTETWLRYSNNACHTSELFKPTRDQLVQLIKSSPSPFNTLMFSF